MGITDEKPVEFLVVDTTAFIQNAPLQSIGDKMVTCPEVIAEITNKRQLRRLVVLPYDLIVKEAFPENIQIITDFAKKTGDYPSLTATDIKVMALTYQLEKEKVGTDHLRTEPVMQKAIVTTKRPPKDMSADVTGFYKPKISKINTADHEKKEPDDETSYNVECSSLTHGEETNQNADEHSNLNEEESKEEISEEESDIDEQVIEQLQNLEMDCSNDIEDSKEIDSVLVSVKESESYEAEESKDVSVDNDDDDDDEDDDNGWITPSNIEKAKKQFNSQIMESKKVVVACITTDFAMQNVLKQMNLNVSALDGRLIKQLRTYILRCYTCFKTTSIMTKKFCPRCGNNTLKKVAVSLDKNGVMKIHINPRHPLTARGKKFSLPRIKGGKHPNNPVLVEDQPMPDNKPSRLARTKNNPLDDDYIAGFSPFVMRDVNSKSAQLCIRPGQEFKYWMRKNPNESRRKRK